MWYKHCSVQFSHSVVSNSLWPHGLQHTRLPCPSPTPRACSNLSPSSRWYHPTISSSGVPFSSSCLRSFLHQGLFQGIGSSHQEAKYWSFSFSISPSNEHSGLISMTLDSAVCPRARTHWTKSHGTEVGMALITTLSHLFGEFLLPSHATQLWLIPVPYIGEEEAASTTKRHSKSFIKSKARDFLDGPVVKNPPANAGDTDPIPGSGRFHMLCGN